MASLSCKSLVAKKSQDIDASNKKNVNLRTNCKKKVKDQLVTTLGESLRIIK